MPRYSESEAREAVASSRSYSEALRKLGLRPAGGNHKLLRRYVDEIWRIPTDHFDPYASSRGPRPGRRPLDAIMVERSTYERSALKRRLLADGLKERRCEACGQDEQWRGRRMALILDHINGVPDDNRLVNLRILCPNCAATLDTHCARKNRREREPRRCAVCGASFAAKRADHRYCSVTCSHRRLRRPAPERRKVPRPPYDQLLAEIAAEGYSAVGRRYGVSDNAIRKWVRQYERERGADEDFPGRAPER